VVSSRDYFIATHFDKDKDGILSTEERKECMKALRDGYEK